MHKLMCFVLQLIASAIHQRQKFSRNFIRSAWALFALVLSSLPSSATTAADFLSATLPKIGAEPNNLPYRYLVPPSYNSANSYPLIVFLHGSGERGADNSAQLNNNANGAMLLVSTANEAAYPSFMLAPQASVAEGWNNNTLAQVIRAIQQLKSMYSIDFNRVYVTGLSLGGGGTFQIITSYPFTFAAAVPMSGWGAGSYEKNVGIPLWAFHAVNDPTVGVAGSDNAVGAIRQLGGRVIYTRYATGGHGIWPTAYANPYLLPWMMAQRRNQPVSGVPLITIGSPTPHVVPPPVVTSRNVSSTSSIPGGVTQVNWTFTPSTGGAGVDISSYALATGTTAWSVTNAPVSATSTLFVAVATGPSWATGTGSSTGGGVTTLTDYFWNVPTGANLTAPSVIITTPAGSGSFTTSVATLDLTGASAVAAGSGKSVKAITWSNDRGGEGIGIGTTSWSIQGIDLQPGDNALTVTVRDSSNITARTTLLVHATFGGGGAVAPTITTPPQGLALMKGDTANFSVSASGSAPLAYQWKKDGVAIPGATAASYTVSEVQPAHAGNYSVVVSNSAGNAISNSVALTVALPPPLSGRLVNLSIRAAAGSGDQTLIVGFIVSGSGDLPVLLRGWGPTLAAAPFNVGGVLADPLLRTFRGSTQVAQNDDWGNDPQINSVTARVGAYPFAPTSKEAAISTSFAPGGTTAHVVSSSTGTGVVLAELFDATALTTESSPRLSNMSARTQVGVGDNVLIGGFVIGGSSPVKVLIRAVGPSLTQFSVGGVLADPILELHSSSALLQTNDNWWEASNAAEVTALNGQVGFVLPSNSTDAVILATLSPGLYSAVVRGSHNSTGVALLEIYEIR